MFTMGPPLWSGAITDPFFSNVVLLVHGNGTNGGTSFPDSSSYARAATVVGGVTTATDGAAFLGSSIKFIEGVAVNYVEFTAAAFLGSTTSAYTVECFVDLSAVVGSNSDANFLRLTTGASIFLELGTIFANTIGVRNPSGYQVSVADYLARMHIAVVRDAGTGNTRWYIGGVVQSTGPETPTTSDFDKIRIGSSPSAPASASDGGFISEIRVSTVARYTGSSFAPPVASFPNS